MCAISSHPSVYFSSWCLCLPCFVVWFIIRKATNDKAINCRRIDTIGREMILCRRWPYNNDTNIHGMAHHKLDNKPYRNGCGDFGNFYIESRHRRIHIRFLSRAMPTSLPPAPLAPPDRERKNKKWQCLWFYIRMRFDAEFHLRATTFIAAFSVGINIILNVNLNHIKHIGMGNISGCHTALDSFQSNVFVADLLMCMCTLAEYNRGICARDHDVASQFKSQIAPIFICIQVDGGGHTSTNM